MTDGEQLDDVRLRKNMADPDHAVILTSPAGRKIAYRMWPGDDSDERRAAFLDGLARLADQTGMDVYGIWALCGDDLTTSIPPDAQCQLWLANDRLKLMDGTLSEAVEVISARY